MRVSCWGTEREELCLLNPVQRLVFDGGPHGDGVQVAVIPPDVHASKYNLACTLSALSRDSMVPSFFYKGKKTVVLTRSRADRSQRHAIYRRVDNVVPHQ